MTLVVLVVVPHPQDQAGPRQRFLVIEERDGTFYLPAGRVDPGEDLVTAALRETAEEAGVPVRLHGLLGFDHESSRMRFCFAASLVGDPPLKAIRDHHSRGARWATKPAIADLPLRHPEVLDWIARYETGRMMPIDAYQAYGLR